MRKEDILSIMRETAVNSERHFRQHRNRLVKMLSLTEMLN